MRNIIKAAALAVSITMPTISCAMEMEFKAGDLTLRGVSIRATMPGRPGAAYVTVINDGNQADKIVSASSPMAERAELHTHLQEDGVMKMRQIENIEIPAKSTVHLKPGGLHIMMFGLKSVPKKGEMVPITITFEKTGKADVKAMVRAMKGGMNHGSGNHGQSNTN